MEDKNKIKVIRQLSFIKENVIDIDGIIDRLIENEVIPITDRETFTLLRSKERMQSIIDIVLKKDKIQIFLLALAETRNEHIVDKITNCDSQNERMPMKENLPLIHAYTQTSDNYERKLSKENENLTKELEDTRKDYKALREDHDKLKKMQSSLREELNRKHAKHAEMNKQLRECKTEIEKTKAENEEIDSLKTQLIFLRETTRVETDSLSKEISCLQETNRKTEEDMKELKLQFQTVLENFSIRLNNEKTDNQSNMNAMQIKITELETKHESMKLDYTELKNEMEETKKAQTDFMNKAEKSQSPQRNTRQSKAISRNHFANQSLSIDTGSYSHREKDLSQSPVSTSRRPIGRRKNLVQQSRYDRK